MQFPPLYTWLHPVLTALSTTVPLNLWIRLRLLAYQPIVLLTNTITSYRYILNPPFTVHYAPSRGIHRIRYLLIFPPNYTPEGHRRYPLHIAFHSGAFLGGIPESTIPWLQYLCETTNSIIVSGSYRFTPLHPFPAAVEDAEDLLLHLLEVAPSWGADINRITVSGFSAGGGLALSMSLHEAAKGRIKAAVLFYSAIDMRKRREDKPKPEGMPKDPFAWIGPLIDTYAPSPQGARYHDERLAPVDVEDIRRLPDKVLMVVAGKDILVEENLRLKQRLDDRAEMKVWGGRWHGWLEMPGMEKEQKEVFEGAAWWVDSVLSGQQSVAGM
ncbi:putative lipase/esterase family protein [Pyronema omphalodes]|nr:putative lipase/esterase family protein [Pyronema omphalodes]